MITLNEEQAASLTKLVKWFRRMIVDRNIGTTELTAAYCDELIEALKPQPQIHSKIIEGKATRDIKAGEMITVEISEYLKLLEKENGKQESLES